MVNCQNCDNVLTEDDILYISKYTEFQCPKCGEISSVLTKNLENPEPEYFNEPTPDDIAYFWGVFAVREGLRIEY